LCELFHFQNELVDLAEKRPMSDERRNSDDQPSRRVEKRFGDPSRKLERVTDPQDADHPERPDHSGHRPEQAEERSDRRQRSEKIEVVLEAARFPPSGELDGFLDLLLVLLRDRQAGRENPRQGGVARPAECRDFREFFSRASASISDTSFRGNTFSLRSETARSMISATQTIDARKIRPITGPPWERYV
jgi:hypothetical protein